MSEPATSEQLLQQGLFHHRQGDLAAAMERYVEVLQRDPQNADALYYVAVVACQDEQFQQGVELARRAIANGPPQARVHNLLGQALYRLGEPMEAIKNFDRAIALDANFADAHGNRANILVDAGLPDEALKSFDRALELNPASGPDWLNRGALLQELGRHADALASFDKAVICGPEVAEAHVNRANALKDLGHLDAAGGLHRFAALRRSGGGLQQGDRARAAARRGLSRARPARFAARRLGGRLSRLRTPRESRRADIRCAGSAALGAANRLLVSGSCC